MRNYETKEIVVIVKYAENSQVNFKEQFSSISQTYTGYQVDSFLSSVQGLLSVCPTFFDNVSDESFGMDLIKLGFEQVEPTALERMMHEQITPAFAQVNNLADYRQEITDSYTNGK